MGDLALVVFFFSMLMVPCYLATRTVRDGRAAGAASAGGILAVAERFEDGVELAGGFDSSAVAALAIDRRALAIQRNREIYFRTGGRPPQADYGPLTARDRHATSSYLNRRAG